MSDQNTDRDDAFIREMIAVGTEQATDAVSLSDTLRHVASSVTTAGGVLELVARLLAKHNLEPELVARLHAQSASCESSGRSAARAAQSARDRFTHQADDWQRALAVLNGE